MESKIVIALFCVFAMAELTEVRGGVETKSKIIRQCHLIYCSKFSGWFELV